MVSLFERPQAERTKIADAIDAAAPNMTTDERRELIAALSASLEKAVKVEAVDAKTKTVLERIQACHADRLNGGHNQMLLANGALSRAGIEPLEKLAFKEPHEINKILASAAKLSMNDRFAVKGLLNRLGALPQ
jgi:hypothetical protein